jgi:N-methylhydantoinase B
MAMRMRTATTKPENKSRGPRAERKVDPVITEIVRNGVIAVTEEMKTNLMRTAYNIIIYEALDFTTGLFTPRGETISIGIGLPMFIRGMAETVKAKIRHFGADRIRPGDIYVTNDSYITGSHLNHVTLTLPIFHAGELVAFSCCMAHWLDIGGILGGMSTDIFSEGLQIPILKYQDQGVVNQTLVDFIRQNVRVPSRAMGDLRAQVTAVKTGERRFLELIGRYGRHAVVESIKAIMDHAEAMARTRTRSIPDGVYEAESYMDDDGIDIGKKVPIRVRVIVRGDEMTVDLSEVSAQVRGFYNSGITTGHACAQVAYKCITSPRDYPINDGSFRSLRTIVPPGRVISAVRPAPMRWWMTYPMTIVDTIFKALAPAIPARVIAGHHADLLAAYFHGINDRTDEFFIGSFGPLGGGWGAKMSEDGVSATVCINDGDTHNSPNEQAEFKFPIVVERYALIADSGGAGRRRGGLGVERVVRARSNMVVNNQSERAHCLPWGLAGGLDGTGNAVELRIGGHWKSDFPNAKVLVAQLKPGDAFKIRSGGGGGYGSALERPIAQVANDVRQGYVTVEAAAELYGVIIDPQTFAADQASTDKLRARLRSQLEQRGAAAVAQAVSVPS